jgi:DNA-binding NarL/FixJ family response regulator
LTEDGLTVNGANILIVDDFPGWRDQVRAILRPHPEWKVVDEACDGLEGVHKAIQLQPDVVVLDIGLPGVNGIEAARRIRRRCPKARIVFLSQDGDSDIMHAALRVGWAYVLKAKAAVDLCDAIAISLRETHAAVPRD